MGNGLLFAFGGALSGIGQGMEKSGILDREMALKNLDIIAANARSDKEIAARQAIATTDQAGASQRNADTIKAENSRNTDNRTSMEKIAADNRKAEDARNAANNTGAALRNPMKLADGTMAVAVDDGKGGLTTKPVTGADGKPVKGIKSADDAIEQMRVYQMAVKTNQTKDPDSGSMVTDWNAVADNLDKVGYKDLAGSARSEAKSQPVNQDMWDTIKSKWDKKASEKAGWFSSDKTDFGDGGRDAWINAKALSEYRARGGTGLPDDLQPDTTTTTPTPGAPAQAPAAPGAAPAPAPAAAGQAAVVPDAGAATYASDADVKAAVRAGKLTRDQGIALLQSKFGYK